MSERQLMKLPSHDVLAQLARDDPPAFEALRSELMENCINGAPERIRHRLRQLQFRVDGIRRVSRSPLGATLRIHALMWESFLEMNEKLQGFARQTPRRPHLVAARADIRPCPARNACIIEFRPRPPAVVGLLSQEPDGLGRL
jgi:hypothetical protein